MKMSSFEIEFVELKGKTSFPNIICLGELVFKII